MIRTATHADLDALIVLGAAMHRESNFAPLNFDPQRTANFVRYMMDHPDGLVLVAERDDELIGYFMAFASVAWFGDGEQKIANDMSLYVRPENRRGATAVLLVQGFRDWARRQGYAQARAGTSAGREGQAANAIYAHVGFVPAGSCFVLDNLPKRVVQTFDHHLAVQ